MCDHHNHQRQNNKQGLIIALIITTGILLLEFFGGLITNSLALLADSGHMLVDAASLLLSLIAMLIATRPVSENKTYGFYRFEIIAALFNGITLFIICGFIIKESVNRLFHPEAVSSLPMMIIAVIGLIANGVSAYFLMKKGDVKENVNLRGAYLHIIGDMLGSVGVIIAGIVIMLTGWYIADPIVSIIFAIIILKGAWGLLKKTIHILMEGSPFPITEVKATIEKIDGVVSIHNLHIWTITSDIDALSCHVVIKDIDCQIVLKEVVQEIKDKFNITYVTIQIEEDGTHCHTL